MIILCCGDRHWKDYEKVHKRLIQLDTLNDIIVTGACIGADKICETVGENLGFNVEVYPANWYKYGVAAGPIRNKQMLDTGVNLVIAFHSNIESSKGTKNCLEQATKRGIPVEIIV